jgi:hypothetical protein
MDLVAGEAREIMLSVGVEDWAGLRDPSRFAAHISLGGGMDPTWLDLFAQAAREISADDSPAPLSESVYPVESGLTSMSERTVERVDPAWVDAVALLPDRQLDRVAGRWIELIEREECDVDAEEKPMLRQLTADLVDFCRRAEDAEDVLFVWSL